MSFSQLFDVSDETPQSAPQEAVAERWLLQEEEDLVANKVPLKEYRLKFQQYR